MEVGNVVPGFVQARPGPGELQVSSLRVKVVAANGAARDGI